MLESSITAASLSGGIVLLHLVISSGLPWLRRLGTLLASVVMAFALCDTTEKFAIVSAAALILVLSGPARLDLLIKKFIIVLIISSGNWLQPNMPELVLLLLSFCLYINTGPRDSIATSLILMWSISFVAFVVAEMGAFSPAGVNLLLCLLLLGSAHAVLWLDFEKFNLLKGTTIILAVVTSRNLIEAKLSSLGIGEINLLSKMFYLFWSISLISLLIRSSLKSNTYQYFVSSFALALMLPFTPDASLVGPLAISYSLVVAILGLTLMQPLFGAPDSLGKIMYVLIGLTVLASQLIAFMDHSLSRASNLGLVSLISIQLFLLGKTFKGAQRSQDKWYTRERLPQWSYLLVVFGCGVCLWYILNYVSQI